MRWAEISEYETAHEAAQEAAKKRRAREKLDNARQAQSDAARKYQNTLTKTGNQINSAVASLSEK
jgi:uncharacterized FlaG/YvyC family protein